MAKGKNAHISVRSWVFALFIMALPCIGVVMVLIWAFVGGNESRKNFFKAVIIWYLILLALGAAIFLLGFWPEIQRQILTWLHKK